MLFQTRNGIGIPVIETFPELGAGGCTSCQKNGVSLGRLGAGNVVQLQSQIPGANQDRLFGRGLGLDPDVAPAIAVQAAINTAAKALGLAPGPGGGNIDASTLAVAKQVAAAARALKISAGSAIVLTTVTAAVNADQLDNMTDQNAPQLVSAFAEVANAALAARGQSTGMPTAAKVAIGLGLAAGVVAIVMMARR